MRKEREMTATNASNTDWTALQQAEDMAYFKADLCCYSPESYSLEEKKEICNDMISTSKAMLDAMRADFEQLPADARSKLLEVTYNFLRTLTAE